VRLHPAIDVAKTFKLSDSDYQNFTAYLNGKNYQYKTYLERNVDNFKTEAEKDKKWNDIKSEIESIKTKLNSDKKADLTTYKSEIKRVLESEIAQRYYFEKGKTEQAFQYDTDLKKAYEIFNNSTLMSSVLRGDGTYKTIGKPGKMTAQVDNE
jgi:carboxyl-terminal processing protease